jgi:hypothetical protein
MKAENMMKATVRPDINKVERSRTNVNKWTLAHPKTEAWSVLGFDFMPVPGTQIPDHSKTRRRVRFLNG